MNTALVPSQERACKGQQYFCRSGNKIESTGHLGQLCGYRLLLLRRLSLPVSPKPHLYIFHSLFPLGTHLEPHKNTDIVSTFLAFTLLLTSCTPSLYEFSFKVSSPICLYLYLSPSFSLSFSFSLT